MLLIDSPLFLFVGSFDRVYMGSLGLGGWAGCPESLRVSLEGQGSCVTELPALALFSECLGIRSTEGGGSFSTCRVVTQDPYDVHICRSVYAHD